MLPMPTLFKLDRRDMSAPSTTSTSGLPTSARNVLTELLFCCSQVSKLGSDPTEMSLFRYSAWTSPEWLS